MPEIPANTVEMINARLGGYDQSIGLRFVSATVEEFIAELRVADRHLQPYGLVHGGVLSGMIESVCSTAAAVNVLAKGESAVGLENNISFVRAARSGLLRCTARPVVRGRRSHVWEGQIHDGNGRLVASGRVRMLVLEPGASADGETVALRTEPGPP